MPYILKKYYPARNLIFLIGEGSLIFTALTGAYLVSVGIESYLAEALLYTFRALIVTLVFQICLYYFDLYDLSSIPSFSENAANITKAFGFGCVILSLFYYFFPVIIISTKIFWLGYLTICVNIAIWRFAYMLILQRKMFTRPIVLLGSGVLADKIEAEIKNKKDSGYVIVEHLGNIAPKAVSGTKRAICCCLEKLGFRENADKIVIALDERRGSLPLDELIECKILGGVEIVDGIEFYQELTGKVMVEKLNPANILFAEGFTVGPFTTSGKRLLDILLSLAGLLFSLPITLASGLIIKLESPGPLFYLQERVGEKGRVFKVIKFRSMVSGAEKNGPVWASREDSRVTRFGAIIRKFRIDEIPQMINVLKGDMSFVGPRPERPVFVNMLKEKIPYYAMRHAIKPGITGWAQVLYPYGASEEDALRKLEYDLFYLKNLSLRMDAWIIFQTVKIVLFQKGAR